MELPPRSSWIEPPSEEYKASNPGWDKSRLPGLCEFLSIDNWAEREIHPADRLLGDLVTTTTRMFLVGSTGLGKTLIALAMACGIATGRGFLHWKSDRPARVLYVDGEMPEELIKSRSIDALRRQGGRPAEGAIYIFARDSEEEFAKLFPTLPRFAPLNTKEGQTFIKELIGHLGGIDAIVFDNVMSLISGDQKDEIPWSETLPLVSELTAMRVGQIWADHTGHNRDRQYGSSTKAWRFDAVGIMTALPDDQREKHEVAFTLSFEAPGKARRRTPANWQDFESRTIRLNDDRWTSDGATGGGRTLSRLNLSPGAGPFYDAFLDALAVTDTPGRTSRTSWYAEAVRGGLCDQVTTEDTYRTKDAKMRRFRKYLSEIKTAGLVGINGEEVRDLRAP